VHIDEGLHELLQSARAYQFRIDCTQHAPGRAPNLGWSLLTSAEVQAELEAALRARGFVPGDKIELDRDEPGARVQFPWRRESDWTHASIVVSKVHPDQIRVSCQAPQRARP